MPQRRPQFLNIHGSWFAPAIGMAVGLSYGVLEHTLDFEALRAPAMFLMVDDIVVLCLPVILGLLAGIVFNYVRRQQRLNWVLSTENARLQRHVMAHLLSSYILHEIRNPLHNLTAAVERWRAQLPAEQVALLQRNLDRLDVATRQLTHWGILSDEIDFREPVPLRRWLAEFVNDKVRPHLRELQMTFEEDVADVTVCMHPLLLEHCCVTLFNNAMQAAAAGAPPRLIRLMAKPLSATPHAPPTVELTLSNSGSCYPDFVLMQQGREPVDSQNGLGLGLVLVRRTMEQVGGSLRLLNEDGRATAVVCLPAKP